MSELEKTAPNEIYLIVGDTGTDCNFNELVEVTWDDEPIYEETAIKYVKSSQLTIPQSIADELDGLNPDKGENKIELLFEGYNNSFLSPELMWVCLKNNNLNLCALYLAGKALGVDLVKVVEG